MVSLLAMKTGRFVPENFNKKGVFSPHSQSGGVPGLTSSFPHVPRKKQFR
jgi:hypothetical protein